MTQLIDLSLLGSPPIQPHRFNHLPLTKVQHTHESIQITTLLPKVNGQVTATLKGCLTRRHLSVVVRLLEPEGTIFRAKSQYQRVSLLHRLLKRSPNIFSRNIHPISGQITMRKSFLSLSADPEELLQEMLAAMSSLLEGDSGLIASLLIAIDNDSQSYEQSQLEKFLKFCAKYADSAQQVREMLNNKSRNFCVRPGNKLMESLLVIPHYELKVLSNSEIHELRKFHESCISKIEANMLIKSQTANARSKVIIPVVLDGPTQQYVKQNFVEITEKKENQRIVRLVSTSLGSLYINVRESTRQLVSKRFDVLSKLQPHEYRFLDTYLRLETGQHHIYEPAQDFEITKALKKFELKEFLQASTNSMSFLTRLRILSQVISASQILQNLNSCVLPKWSVNTLQITKSLALKIRNVEDIFSPVYSSQAVSNMRFAESQYSIAQLYFRLFYGRDCLPAHMASTPFEELIEKYSSQRMNIEQESQCKAYGPNHIMKCLNRAALCCMSPTKRSMKWFLMMIIKVLQSNEL